MKIEEASQLVDVLGFERYAVDRDGNIWSKPKKTRKGYRIVTPTLWGKYMSVGLYDNEGRRHRITVHKIVATAFCARHIDDTQINHIDGNKTNNKASNLEWCTASHNINHAIDNGLLIPATGARALTDAQIDCMNIEYATTDITRQLLADKYKVSIETVKKYTRDIKKKSYKGKYIGRPSPSRKIDCDTAYAIRKATKQKGKTNKSIAIEFGVGEHIVGKIKKGLAYADCY